MLSVCSLTCIVSHETAQPTIAYCLLPIAYCLLHIAYCLLPVAYCLCTKALCIVACTRFCGDGNACKHIKNPLI